MESCTGFTFGLHRRRELQPVRHHARYGRSKYGCGGRSGGDGFVNDFVHEDVLTRPMHVFGCLVCFRWLGTVLGLYLTFLKLGLGQSIGTPLLILAVLLLVTGVQLFSFDCWRSC